MPRLTDQELHQLLRDELTFMERSAAAFDNGDTSEARRLATSIYKLVHAKNRNRALLDTLGVLNGLEFWTVLPALPKEIYSYVGVQMNIGQTMEYAPKLIPPNRKVGFPVWWNEEPLIVANGHRLTRYSAVVTLRDKEGGHIDPELSDEDHALVRTDVVGWEFFGGMQQTGDASPIRAAVRQIAHEFIETVREQLADLLGAGG